MAHEGHSASLLHYEPEPYLHANIRQKGTSGKWNSNV
jgi:hypothetical protein